MVKAELREWMFTLNTGLRVKGGCDFTLPIGSGSCGPTSNSSYVVTILKCFSQNLRAGVLFYGLLIVYGIEKCVLVLGPYFYQAAGILRMAVKGFLVRCCFWFFVATVKTQ